MSSAPALTAVGRPQPSSIEAERACLGAVMLEGAGALRDLDELAIDDLLMPAHREILAAMRDLRARGSAVDVVTLVDELRTRGVLGKLEGGQLYISGLPSAAPVGNLAHHVAIVRDLAARRRLIASGYDLASRAHGGDDPAEIIDETRAQLARIGSGRADVEIRTVSEIALSVTEPLPDPISTGLSDLNTQLGGGFFPESEYAMPGPTGRGKTALAAQISMHVSLTQPVVYLTTELRAPQIVARVVAPILGRPWVTIWRQLHLERDAIARALADRKLIVVDGTRQRDLDPRRVADAAAQRFGRAPLLVIDYLQDLTRRRGSALDDRRLAVAAMSDVIRQWAVDTQGTALVVSSAARTWSTSDADRSTRDYASSTKESGDVDSDAAGIIFVDIEPCPPGGVATATLRVAKSRYFTPGEVRLEYVGALGLFRVPTGPALTPMEAAILAAVRAGAKTRTAIATEVGFRKAAVVKSIKDLVGRGVLNADLTLAEGGL
jgi:replicative DNA helicase